MIGYIHPRVFSDSVDIGDIVTALINNPAQEAEILKAFEVAWDSHKGSANESANKAAIEAANIQVQTIQAERDAAIAEIATLKQKLAPDIASIADALLNAGLYAWAQDAVSAVDSEQGKAIMELVIKLKMVAVETPSITQCDRIKQLFGAVMAMSKVEPTHEQATAMQSVLDAGSPSTGPVGKDYLDFHPWIKSASISP